MSKAILNKVKAVLPTLISSQQAAYLKNRFIGESGSSIFDIIEISNRLNIDGFLITMDTEKALDSLEHDFLSSVLRKFGFGKNFITWIEILLKDQLPCAANGGTTTQYFNLERSPRPISAYLFILTSEMLFLLLEKHPKIKGMGIFEQYFFYTVYTDDTTFFLIDSNSIANLVEIFNTFFVFSGLKSNLTKCKIARIGALDRVQLAVCAMKWTDLRNEAIETLGTYFSYNNTIKEESNFPKVGSNVQIVLKLRQF